MSEQRFTCSKFCVPMLKLFHGVFNNRIKRVINHNTFQMHGNKLEVTAEQRHLSYRLQMPSDDSQPFDWWKIMNYKGLYSKMFLSVYRKILSLGMKRARFGRLGV